jgi:photoactive yellow protein
MNFFTKLALLARNLFAMEEISDRTSTTPDGPASPATTPTSAAATRPEPVPAVGVKRADAASDIAKQTGEHSFVPPELLANLPSMKQTQMDMLDFGCIKLDDEGRILNYNRWQGEFAGVDPQEALRKNFFRELAPCTNNRLVFGRFKQGVTDGALDVVVSYAFTYKMRPTLVKVHLYRDSATRTNWILVRRVGGNK